MLLVQFRTGNDNLNVIFCYTPLVTDAAKENVIVNDIFDIVEYEERVGDIVMIRLGRFQYGKPRGFPVKE